MTKENKEKELKEEVQQTPAAESEIEADVQEIQEENEEKQPEPDEIGLLNSKVEELEAKLAREKDDYIRLMAEFDNFRRRTSQEKLDLVSVASMDTIKGLLPILDDCERALAVLGESSDSEAAKEGTNLIYTKLLNYLQSKGLAVIEAAGQVFDTDLHEAVAQFPVQEEEKKGKVFDVVQTGYTLNGKVIRFAKVVVGI
ncbi:MAG: nucleotide exchange factor GrpE [Bacteroidales bacterium]|nr:nucleotide exchange factor GrpE [Bacteroidales bacterium]MDD5911691.1 nucleotide exchange factor GrpE [Bacteroidales bacterium]